MHDAFFAKYLVTKNKIKEEKKIINNRIARSRPARERISVRIYIFTSNFALCGVAVFYEMQFFFYPGRFRIQDVGLHFTFLSCMQIAASNGRCTFV